jgi:hypothetical protein
MKRNSIVIQEGNNMINMNITPDEFIKVLLKTATAYKNKEHPLVEIYTSGSCYKFYELLKYIFPEAKAYYTKDRNHIVIKIGDNFYDITGKVKSKYLYSGKYDDLELDENDHKRCKKWIY